MMKSVIIGLGIGAGLIAALGITVPAFKNYMEGEVEKAESECRKKTHVLELGESKDICGNYIRYNGLVSDKSFCMYSSRYDLDLFFPAKKGPLVVREYNFRVEDISPERLILTYHGNNR